MTAAHAAGVVILGGGQAGGESAAALRMAGYTDPIVLVSQETHLPYSRPPLSKGFLLGEVGVDSLLLRPAAFYEKHGVRTLLGLTANRIDRRTRTVVFEDETSLSYDTLILATGGEARRLPDPAAQAASNVHYVRNIGDVDRLRRDLQPGANLVVIGGGYVGLEIAAVARKLDVHVTVVEAAERLLARVAGPEISEFVRRVHAEEGVEVRLGSAVTGFGAKADGAIETVVLSDGTTLPTDVIVVGVGLTPNDELAVESGLAVGDGILVDSHCRTSEPSIYAIGDCSRHPAPDGEGTRRLESVQNASEQARVVAAAITGNPRVYDAVPWFWSDQFDLKIRSVGLAAGCDETVVRGTIEAGRSVSVFYTKDGHIRAADVVSNLREFGAAKRLVATGARVDRDVLADSAVALGDLAKTL